MNLTTHFRVPSSGTRGDYCKALTALTCSGLTFPSTFTNHKEISASPLIYLLYVRYMTCIVEKNVTSLARTLPHCAIQLRAGVLMTSTRVAVVVVTVVSMRMRRVGGGRGSHTSNRFRVRSHLTMTVWLFSPLSAFMIERLHCKLTPTSLRSAFRTQNATCPNGFLQLLRKDLHFQRLLKHEYSRKWFSDQLTHEKSSKQKRSISIMTTKLTTPYIHTY